MNFYKILGGIVFKKIASISKEKKLVKHEMSALKGSASKCGTYCPDSNKTGGFCCQCGYASGFGAYYLAYFPEEATGA
jgi:hypothetical protein